VRWLTFILLAVVALTLQTAVAPRVAPFDIRPDWLLIVVVFIALHAPPRAAIVGAWIIGGLADLMTIERLGLVAVSYTLAATFIISIREYLFRYRTTTRFVVTLTACLLVRALWTGYSRAVYDLERSLLAALTLDVLLASVYTALWALPVHEGLRRVSRTFGLVRLRYNFAA
jgi:rod shape-determining protein MreD